MRQGETKNQHVAEENNCADRAVALVLLLFGLALGNELGVVLGQIAL